MGTITPLAQSLGTLSSSHIILKNNNRESFIASPPFFKISFMQPSSPAAFPFPAFFNALSSSPIYVFVQLTFYPTLHLSFPLLPLLFHFYVGLLIKIFVL